MFAKPLLGVPRDFGLLGDPQNSQELTPASQTTAHDSATDGSTTDDDRQRTAPTDDGRDGKRPAMTNMATMETTDAMDDPR